MSKIVKRVTLPASIRAFTQHRIEMSSPQIIVIDESPLCLDNNDFYRVLRRVGVAFVCCHLVTNCFRPFVIIVGILLIS